MDRTRFEVALKRDGFELVEIERAPDSVRATHAHDFDARLLVLDGALTLSVGGEDRTYRAGEDAAVPAGTPHAEHAGAHGARFLLGKRRQAS